MMTFALRERPVMLRRYRLELRASIDKQTVVERNGKTVSSHGRFVATAHGKS